MITEKESGQVGSMGPDIIKATTFYNCPKMKSDAWLKAVFFPRKRLLLVGHLFLPSGVLFYVMALEELQYYANSFVDSKH